MDTSGDNYFGCGFFSWIAFTFIAICKYGPFEYLGYYFLCAIICGFLAIFWPIVWVVIICMIKVN